MSIVRELYPEPTLSGVYLLYGTGFLFHDGSELQLFYVGQSINIFRRFDTHRRRPDPGIVKGWRNLRLVLLEDMLGTMTGKAEQARLIEEKRFTAAAVRIGLPLANSEHYKKSAKKKFQNDSLNAESFRLYEAIELLHRNEPDIFLEELIPERPVDIAA